MILTGDCLEVMPTLEAESVDAVVTDPPYGLEFMGKEWDKLLHPQGGKEWARGNHGGLQRPRYRTEGMQAWHERWAAEAFRLAKPSAYLLAFGGTRTVHRMTCAIEDAGWIVRDMLVWAYASGFPKSKASLKPAWEPIVMARKPGPLRELNIDGGRIPGQWSTWQAQRGEPIPEGGMMPFSDQEHRRNPESPLGRWPGNVILTDPIFDGGWDGVVGGGETSSGSGAKNSGNGTSWEGGPLRPLADKWQGDVGTYSRFFLIPKADRAEREPIWAVPEVEITTDRESNAQPRNGRSLLRANVHPTVKPLELMRHLVRLVTPTGGTVLDPFLGSGTTGIAAEMEGFRWLGIEREPEYVRIAEARLHGTQRGLGLPESATNPGPVLTAYAQELRRLVPEEPDGRG